MVKTKLEMVKTKIENFALSIAGGGLLLEIDDLDILSYVEYFSPESTDLGKKTKEVKNKQTKKTGTCYKTSEI